MSRDEPSQEDIAKTVEEALQEKYGDAVKLANLGVLINRHPSFMRGIPRHEEDEEEELSINFDLKPEELKAYLDEYVIKQERAKEVLATKVCTHYHRARKEVEENIEFAEDVKKNILLIGPTGCGKTYVVKKIAEKLNVPFVSGDATKFSETGYVGGDVEDMVRALVKKADGNIKLAQYGIIYIDEIDKIARTSDNMSGRDVSGRGVQINLLKLMEETEVELYSRLDPMSGMRAMEEMQRTGQAPVINTRNILFIVSGAFPGLEDIIDKKIRGKRGIGFQNREDEKFEYDSLDELKADDLVTYGLEREFAGRLPVRAVLEELEEDDLYQILKNSKGSIIESKKRDFQAYGIKLEFEDDALKEIAKKAYKEKIGARALVQVCEEVLLPYECHLPSMDVQELKVTKAIVQDPHGQYTRLIGTSSLDKYCSEFEEKSGIKLSITDDARKYVVELAAGASKSPYELCQDMFSNYEHGLKLVQLPEIIITKDVAQDPQAYLDNLLKDHFKS